MKVVPTVLEWTLKVLSERKFVLKDLKFDRMKVCFEWMKVCFERMKVCFDWLEILSYLKTFVSENLVYFESFESCIKHFKGL